MKINLISSTDFKLLLSIYKQYPNLTLENKGYETLNLTKLSKEEKTAFNIVSNILRDSIVGFQSFNNFKHNKDGEVVLRFQYDWTADGTTGISFTGVGYILLEELHRGFKISVRNTVEDRLVFKGFSEDFLIFANLVRQENGDINVEIKTTEQAKEYIENFCPNLKLI